MCTIKLKTFDKTDTPFVVSKGTDPATLAANGKKEETALVFEVIQVGGFDTGLPLQYQFKTGDEYASLASDSDFIVLSSDNTSENSKFTVFWKGCKKIALQASNGDFVSRLTGTNDELQANRTQIGPWETFEVVEVTE